MGSVAACAAALAGGMALGWAHGAETAPDTAVAAASTLTPVEGDAEPAIGVTQAPSFEAEPYEGKVYAIGDSVLAGAEPCLTKLGYVVSARQSRQVTAGLDVVRDKGKRLPARVLVHLGTNGGATREDLDEIMGALGTQRLVVWATIQLPDDPSRYTYEERTNAAIEELAGRYANVRILDWNALTQQFPEWVYLEGIHMTPEGCAGYARVVDGLVRAPSPFGNTT